LRIAVISSSLFPCNPESYGSEVQNYYLANNLAGMGHEVTLYAVPQSLHGRAKLRLIPCTYGRVSYEAESKPYEDPEYRELLFQCDLIIDWSATNYVSESFYWWERDRLYRDLVLVYARNGMAFNSPRFPANQFLHGVALSECARTCAIKEWGIPDRLMHVIPYGVDTDIYRFQKNKSDYILYLGRPHYQKGCHRLLMLAERLPDEKFMLAWRTHTDEHKRYEQMFKHIVKWKDLKNVEFHELPRGEEQAEKVRLYQRAKAFITPHDKRYREAFGLTLVEAMSCGTPCITSNHGSAPEVVENDVTGFLCESLDEYSEAIKNVDRIDSKACRERVLTWFSKEAMAQNYGKLYGELKA